MSKRLSEAEMAEALTLATAVGNGARTKSTKAAAASLASALLDCHDDLRALAEYVRANIDYPLPAEVINILARVGGAS